MTSRDERPFLLRRPLGLLVCLLPLATPAAHAAKGAGAGLAATPSSTTEESRDHLSLAVMGDEVGSQDLLAAVAKAHPQEIEASLPGASDYEIQENQVANAYETHSISINGADRRYTLTEAGGSKVVLRPGLSGQLHLAPGWDGAILVADATQPASTLAFSLTPAAGVPKIVVFMDRVADLTADEVAVFEADLRALLSAYDYDGAQVPILQGSAAGLVNGDPGWEATVSELLAAVDAWIPTPARTVDAPFALTVDEVMAITGRGTVANGVIASGRIHSGDEILIDGASVSVEVEAFRKTQDQGQAGDTVGLLLRGIEKDDIKRGMVIIKHQTSDGETVVDGVQAVPGGVRVQGTYTTDTPLKKGDRVALIGFGSFSVSKKTPNPPVVSDVHGLSIHDRGEAGDNVWLTFPRTPRCTPATAWERWP